MSRNLKDEILNALAGGAPERVPFTFYDLLTPPGFDLAPLQARGLAICARRDVYRMVRPNVTVETTEEPGGFRRSVHRTPVGNLTEVWQRAALGSWSPYEHLIKSRADYCIAEFMVNDTHYLPSYDIALADSARLGNGGIVIAHSGYSPLLEIQVMWLGQERFCYELADNEDALMDLYEALRRKHREMYAVVAKGPAEHVLHCGNVVPTMLGPERIRDLVLPCWREFADRLHECGKKMGVHLDADNRLIMDQIRGSNLDMVEAFTPPPDCSVSVTEARAAWTGKRLWINFPSSVHLQFEEAIRAATREIIRQAGDRHGFLMGVTEDVPAEHISRSFNAILDVLGEYAK